MENFTTCLLDPLKYDERRRKEFGDTLDGLFKKAIKLNQKKVRGVKKRTAKLIKYTLSFLYRNTFYKNIQSEMCKILDIF